MDFITIWKASSIILTGGFGVLGLLKDFKDKKTGQITRWGTISLCGILLSTTLGVIAQLKEASQKQKASEATAKATLDLAQKTDQTVRYLERMLSSLDDPVVDLTFEVDCADQKYKAVCDDVGRRTPQRPDGKDEPDLTSWQKWPGGPNVNLQLSIYFFVDPNQADSFLKGNSSGSPDLSFFIDAKHEPKNSKLELLRIDVPYPGAPYRDPVLWLRVNDFAPRIEDKTGKLKSVKDFAAVTMVLIEGWGFSYFEKRQLVGLSSPYLRIRTKRGQSISPKDLERTEYDGNIAYKATFEPDSFQR